MKKNFIGDNKLLFFIDKTKYIIYYNECINYIQTSLIFFALQTVQKLTENLRFQILKSLS